jgi:hypothetical protein
MRSRNVLTVLLLTTFATSVLAQVPTLGDVQESIEDQLKKTLLEDPVKLVVGYQDQGVGATAKGNYVAPLGRRIGRFTRGVTYGVDGAWTSNPDKPDQVEFSGGFGLVELNDGYPRFSGFVRIMGKNGEFEKDDSVQKVNQLLAGAVVEYVPLAWSKWAIDQVSDDLEVSPFFCYALTKDDLTNHPECAAIVTCRDLSPAERDGRDECEVFDPCLGLTSSERARFPGCKIRPGPPLQVPPRFTFGYYHPVRTDGDANLPENIDAGKVTATFEADNVVGARFPLRLVANISGTYALGGDKEFGGKIDVGVGLPQLSEKFTPIVKYVSGEKDGFEYDQAVILGVIVDFAKTFITPRRE